MPVSSVKKLLKRVSLGLAALFFVVLTVVMFREPLLDRDWDDDVSVLAGVELLDNGRILLNEVRDWHYAVGQVTSTEYFDATFDPDDIAAMWMYEQQLDPAGLIAHTFIVFEFDESYERERFLGLSVETRRERGEQYSILGGVLRAFEITHVWATESDLVTRRVQFLDYPLTRYRLDIPAANRAQIFKQFVLETHELSSEPRWYNTATNNCTSSLIKYVNDSEPGAIPLHYSYVLTGKVDDYLEKLGYKVTADTLDITRGFLASRDLR